MMPLVSLCFPYSIIEKYRPEVVLFARLREIEIDRVTALFSISSLFAISGTS